MPRLSLRPKLSRVSAPLQLSNAKVTSNSDDDEHDKEDGDDDDGDGGGCFENVRLLQFNEFNRFFQCSCIFAKFASCIVAFQEN